MRNVFSGAMLIAVLIGLVGVAVASTPAAAGSKSRWGNVMYTYYCCPNKPRRAFPQFGPVFRGPGYAYWGPPTYNLGVPHHYRVETDSLFAIRR